MSDWFVYIIEASDGSLYTGVTTDVQRRFAEHAGKGRGARFFNGRIPLKVVFSEHQADHGSALRREAEIKKLTRVQKQRLIAQVD